MRIAFDDRGNSPPRSNLTITPSYMTSRLGTPIPLSQTPKWTLQGRRHLEEGSQRHLRIRRTRRRGAGGALWRREEFIACDARRIALTKASIYTPVISFASFEAAPYFLLFQSLIYSPLIILFRVDIVRMRYRRANNYLVWQVPTIAVERGYRGSLQLATCDLISSVFPEGRSCTTLSSLILHTLLCRFPLIHPPLFRQPPPPFFPSFLISTLNLSNEPSISLNFSSSSLRLLVQPFSFLSRKDKMLPISSML